MSLRLRIYLSLVALGAVGLLLLSGPPALEERWVHFVAWTVVCFMSESLWLPTLSGGGTASMASAANLATLMLWGPSAAIWIVPLSTLLANVFLQKKTREKVLFNVSESVITMWAAGVVMVWLGGPPEGLHSAGMNVQGQAMLALLPPFLGIIATFWLVNRALVSAAVAWSTDRPYLTVLHQDWFYRERLFDDLALFLLSLLMVISFAAIGYVGLLLFFAPLRIIFESGQRYAELRRTQNMLIYSERMAAKGEMAAELGHELRNQLVAVKGRAQMLLRDAERQQFGNVSRHAQIVLEQAHRMEAMSKGLMDFSHKELKIERVDVNALLNRSIEFVRPQNRFDGVEWDLKLDAALPELRADPGQLQQVLINLFQNAADAMSENGHGPERPAVPTPPQRIIMVRSEYDERVRRVRITVADSGPGIPAALLQKVFEPHFTTKVDGHGFGLSTSYRIVMNHGGEISAESPPGHGAQFTVMLPLDGPGSWG
jgi:signal transduction histidine kinase